MDIITKDISLLLNKYGITTYNDSGECRNVDDIRNDIVSIWDKLNEDEKKTLIEIQGYLYAQEEKKKVKQIVEKFEFETFNNSESEYVLLRYSCGVHPITLITRLYNAISNILNKTVICIPNNIDLYCADVDTLKHLRNDIDEAINLKNGVNTDNEL